ncbi:MAG: phosphatase PAP2 family protein [Fervidobacterium sp.]
MQSKLTLIFLLSSMVLSIIAFAQFDILKEIDYDLEKTWQNGNDFITSPITVLGCVTLFFDNQLNSLMPKSNFLSFLNDFDTLEFSALAVLTSLAVYPFDSYTSFTILESFAVTGAITVLLKYIFGRARPYTNSSAYNFSMFSISKDFQSFPSGHSALVWSIFTPLALRYGNGWYIVPTLFSLQRLWSNNHWTSDVLFGASIGRYIGVQFYNNKEVK